MALGMAFSAQCSLVAFHWHTFFLPSSMYLAAKVLVGGC
uniref:Uricase Urate oxidase n=1 Tax=Rhizophora mucronata TaxID=61149 RepID=A0A2P2JP76_RHIMU